MELTEEQRVALAERLWTSVHFDAQTEQAWLDEADRRYARLQSGEDPGLTLEEFFADESR